MKSTRLLTLIFTLALASCGGGGGDDSNNTKSEANDYEPPFLCVGFRAEEPECQPGYQPPEKDVITPEPFNYVIHQPYAEQDRRLVTINPEQYIKAFENTTCATPSPEYVYMPSLSGNQYYFIDEDCIPPREDEDWIYWDYENNISVQYGLDASRSLDYIGISTADGIYDTYDVQTAATQLFDNITSVCSSIDILSSSSPNRNIGVGYQENPYLGVVSFFYRFNCLLPENTAAVDLIQQFASFIKHDIKLEASLHDPSLEEQGKTQFKITFSVAYVFPYDKQNQLAYADIYDFNAGRYIDGYTPTPVIVDYIDENGHLKNSNFSSVVITITF